MSGFPVAIIVTNFFGNKSIFWNKSIFPKIVMIFMFAWRFNVISKHLKIKNDHILNKWSLILSLYLSLK